MRSHQIILLLLWLQLCSFFLIRWSLLISFILLVRMYITLPSIFLFLFYVLFRFWGPWWMRARDRKGSVVYLTFACFWVYIYIFFSLKSISTVFVFFWVVWCVCVKTKVVWCVRPRRRDSERHVVDPPSIGAHLDNHGYIDHFGEGCFVFLSHYAARVLTSCGGGGGGGGVVVVVDTMGVGVEVPWRPHSHKYWCCSGWFHSHVQD